MSHSEDPTRATEHSPLLRKSAQNVKITTRENRNAPTGDVEASKDSPTSESPDILHARKNVKRMLPLLGAGVFLSMLDQTVVAAINGDMGSDVGALPSASWIATSYFLSMTCVQPLYGKLSDIFGRKPCLLFAFTIFSVGSLICGFAATINGMIAGRVSRFVTPLGRLVIEDTTNLVLTCPRLFKALEVAVC